MNSHVTGSSPDPFAKTSTPNPSSTTPVDGEDSRPILIKTTPTMETVFTDFQVFEGTDFINRGDIVTQQFLTTQQWGQKNIYQASAQLPVLQQPDPEGQNGPQPFEPSWQKATKDFFRERVKEKLAKKLKMGESAGTESSVTQETQKPETFVAKEGGEPLSPLPNFQRHFNGIMESVMSEKMETLNQSDKKIVKEAIQETQAAWNLPGTWNPTSLEVKDWTPVKMNTIPPVNMSTAQKEILTLNLTEMLGALDKAGKKIIEELPPNDPERLAVGDLIRVIAQALRDLKGVLREMQIKESEISEKLAEAKFDAIKDKDAQIAETTKKRQEALEARKKQEKTAKIMKIVAPIISVSVSLVGIALLPFSGGASTALIVAGVAVGIAMTAYTVVDSTVGVTQRIMTAFNDWLNKIAPGEENAWKRTLIKAAFVAAIVAVLIVVIVATGGGAVANVASQTTMQIAQAAIKEAIKQVAIQATVITIMSSNVIPELFSTLLLETGAIDKNDAKGKMIAEMVMMFVTMLVVMTAIAKGSGAGASKGIGESIKEGINSIGQTVTRIVDGIKQLMKAVKEGVESALTQIKELIKSLSQMLSQLLTSLKQLPDHVKEMAKDLIDAVKRLKDYIASPAFMEAVRKFPEKAIAHLGKLVENLKSSADKLMKELGNLISEATRQAKHGMEQAIAAIRKSIEAGLDYLKSIPGKIKQDLSDLIAGFKSLKDDPFQTFQTSLRTLGLGADAAAGIVTGVYGLQLSKIYKEIGEMEKSEEILRLVIKLFDQLLTSFQEQISGINEWLNSVQHAMDSAFASSYQIFKKASRA